MHTHTPRILLSLAILAWRRSRPSHKRPRLPRHPKQEGSAQVSFVGTTGNTSTSTFSAGGEYIYRPDKWLFKDRLLFINNQTDGVTSANSLLYAMRAERTLNARTSAFGEYRYFQDELAGVTHRNDVTGGLAYKVATGPTHILTGGWRHRLFERTTRGRRRRVDRNLLGRRGLQVASVEKQRRDG
jgi:putative salt-induced outer membrane protein YdiY